MITNHSLLNHSIRKRAAKLVVMFGLAVAFSTASESAESVVKWPGGRIAITSDGNAHDKDDIGGTPMSLALLFSAGLNDKLVHVDYANHFEHEGHTGEANKLDMMQEMMVSTEGAAARFGQLDPAMIFNCQTHLDAATHNFAQQALRSSAADPLWSICAGPMTTANRYLDAVKTADPTKLAFIRCVSHSANNGKHDPTQSWERMKQVFPSVTYVVIANQNTAGGKQGLCSPLEHWEWLKNSPNPDLQWLYSRNRTAKVNEGKFDVSDAGMVYYVLAGAGNERAGAAEFRALLEHPRRSAKPQKTNIDTSSVPCWQPHDFGFTSESQPANPFMVAFSATVTAPDGKTFSFPGFFDGNGTWKIRVSPTSEGRWSLVTQSSIPELNGQRVTFTGVKNSAPHQHGVLRVDPAHSHHFVFADGTRFFLQAYEYDWLWALDMGDPGVPTIKRTLDLIADHGFNYVIVNSYAHDTKWRKGKTNDDDYGPAPMFPWAGTNESPDHTRPNLAYWQHYDRMMDALRERGMQTHILVKVYNKDVHWPARDSVEEKLFFTLLVARYAAYPNLIWDFAKEAHNEKDLSYKQSFLKFLQDNDPYQHLRTVHDDDVANDSGAYDMLTDFRTDQHHGIENAQGKNANHTGGKHEKILTQRQRRAWPVANVESDYECGARGLNDKTFDAAMIAEATAATLWDIAMAGGYTGYYYTYTAWDVIRPLDVPKGYGYMKTLAPSGEVQHIGSCNQPTNWPVRVAVWRIRARSMLFTKTKPLPSHWKSPVPLRLWPLVGSTPSRINSPMLDHTATVTPVFHRPLAGAILPSYCT